MKPNAWLATFGVIALLLIGGAAFFCLKAKGSYDEAMNGWGDKLTKIGSLSKRVPYPSKEAEEKIKKQLDDYNAEVSDLYQNLNKFQKPLNLTIKDTEFQQLVRTKVEEILGIASGAGFVIEDSEEFYLGFDLYKGRLPSPETVPLLDYELGAIDHLVRKIIESGGDSLVALARDPIPGEEGAENRKQEESVVHKYPVRLKFTGSHEAFQKFVNQAANDKEYFYIFRVMKVENQNPEPPAKLSTGLAGEYPVYKNPNTQEVATPDLLEDWGWPGAPEGDVISAAAKAGFEPASEDARILMGQEKLDVYLIVDIVRFLDPEEVKTAEKKGAAKPRR